MSKSFGDTDAEGWVYGSSYERIDEMKASNNTLSVATTTTLFRKRRWKRTLTCVSKSFLEEIEVWLGWVPEWYG